MIRTKRIYHGVEASDGRRILVDRLWPRGVSKDIAKLDFWAKSVAPSNELRRWYGHDPEKWDEFCCRYFAELDADSESVDELRRRLDSQTVTFVFGSKEEHLNNAAALREYLARTAPARSWKELAPLSEGSVAAVRKISRKARRVARSRAEGGRETVAGIVALFAGPSGTGKTLAAEVLASRLGLVLEPQDLGRVVANAIGETEKNLDRLFEAAERSAGILFFDEADALFGKRSRVQHGHDRYANMEVSYLFGRMRQASTLTILVARKKSSLASKLLEELRVIVDFPRPDAA